MGKSRKVWMRAIEEHGEAFDRTLPRFRLQVGSLLSKSPVSLYALGIRRLRRELVARETISVLPRRVRAARCDFPINENTLLAASGVATLENGPPYQRIEADIYKSSVHESQGGDSLLAHLLLCNNRQKMHRYSADAQDWMNFAIVRSGARSTARDARRCP